MGTVGVEISEPLQYHTHSSEICMSTCGGGFLVNESFGNLVISMTRHYWLKEGCSIEIHGDS